MARDLLSARSAEMLRTLFDIAGAIRDMADVKQLAERLTQLDVPLPEDGGGIGLFALGGNVAQDFFDGAELFGFVVDDEVALVAETLDVLAEDSHAERMEGADGWALGGFAIE